ncbi:MAG: ABC transporter ATP-binding protein [Myxococcota bacterium]
MSAVIEVRGFEKTFRSGLRGRPVEAARGISFEVHESEVFGFLGPNGAGKTTTIKALLGLIRADVGELKLLGAESHALDWRGKVGFMPEQTNFYDYLSGQELVTWFGQLTGLARHEAERQAKLALDRVGLGERSARRLRTYSKGMLQRAGLAQAMVGDPSLLVLDEPMTGLDPVGRKFIRELILELADEGRTIFYSTHILSDVEATCRRVTIVDKGRTVRTGALDEILGERTESVTIELEVDSIEALGTLAESFVQRGPRIFVAEFFDEKAARDCLKQAVSQGLVVRRFEPHRPDLETVFVRTLGGAEGAPA